jgi:hypothetical protein
MTGARAPVEPPGTELQVVRLSRPGWKPVMFVMACIVAAAWVVQAPGRPLLGILGLLPLAVVVLATNTLGLRDRVPLLRSRVPVRAVAGWALIGALFLVTEFFAFSGLGQPSSAGQHVALASRAPASSTASLPSQPVSAAPAPAPPPVSAPAPPVSAPAPAAPARAAVPARRAATPPRSTRRMPLVELRLVTDIRTSCMSLPLFLSNLSESAHISLGDRQAMSWTLLLNSGAAGGRCESRHHRR